MDRDLRQTAFQLGLEGFQPFNEAPAYLSGRVEATQAHGIRISGRAVRQWHGWHNLGARSAPLTPASFVLAVDANPRLSLGAYSLGVQAVETGLSLSVSHFLRSSVALHEAEIMTNVLSAWGYDAAGRRSQNAVANTAAVSRVQQLELRYDVHERQLSGWANGSRLHAVVGDLQPFRLLLRFQAVAVEGDFDVEFSNLLYTPGDLTHLNVLRAWDPHLAPVFISYAHANADRVRAIVLDLRAHGVRVIGDWDFRTGDSLLDRIRTGIAEAAYLVVVVSHASLASEWVNRELQLAVEGEASLGRVKVLPLMIEDCELPAFLGDRLWADFRTLDGDGIEKVLAVLRESGSW